MACLPDLVGLVSGLADLGTSSGFPFPFFPFLLASDLGLELCPAAGMIGSRRGGTPAVSFLTLERTILLGDGVFSNLQLFYYLDLAGETFM